MKLKIKDHSPKVGPKSGAMNPEPSQTWRHNAAKYWLLGDSLAEFSIVSHLLHDCGDSRITHTYAPKTAVFLGMPMFGKDFYSSGNPFSFSLEINLQFYCSLFCVAWIFPSIKNDFGDWVSFHKYYWELLGCLLLHTLITMYHTMYHGCITNQYKRLQKCQNKYNRNCQIDPK